MEARCSSNSFLANGAPVCSRHASKFVQTKPITVNSSAFTLPAPQSRVPTLTATHITRSIMPSSDAAAPSEEDSPRTLKEEAKRSNQEVYDRLIDVFSQRKPEDWRKLIAFSKQWPTLVKGVFKRFEERASIETNEEEQRSMRRTLRKLRTVSDELEQYRKVVEDFRGAPSRDWESMVIANRPCLGADFFDYLELRIRAAGEDKEEAESLAALAAQLAALVEAHDRISRDEEALEAASERFANLLAVDTLEAAEAKIDELAASGRLDPALLLTMAKAYAGVKETDATKEEVKDIMAHLYFKAKESFARQAPPEVRILKFLLSVDSERDRLNLLDQAFQPGMEYSTGDEDYLHTTPEAMMNTITNVLQVYENTRATGTMAGQAASLMNPVVIEQMRELQKIIKQRYM